jgi:hypothetical protein
VDIDIEQGVAAALEKQNAAPDRKQDSRGRLEFATGDAAP